jgi:hypothetical protein
MNGIENKIQKERKNSQATSKEKVTVSTGLCALAYGGTAGGPS